MVDRIGNLVCDWYMKRLRQRWCKELNEALRDKVVSSVVLGRNVTNNVLSGMDIEFTDGTVLELYGVAAGVSWYAGEGCTDD